MPPKKKKNRRRMRPRKHHPLAADQQTTETTNRGDKREEPDARHVELPRPDTVGLAVSHNVWLDIITADGRHRGRGNMDMGSDAVREELGLDDDAPPGHSMKRAREFFYVLSLDKSSDGTHQPVADTFDELPLENSVRQTTPSYYGSELRRLGINTDPEARGHAISGHVQSFFGYPYPKQPAVTDAERGYDVARRVQEKKLCRDLPASFEKLRDDLNVFPEKLAALEQSVSMAVDNLFEGYCGWAGAFADLKLQEVSQTRRRMQNRSTPVCCFAAHVHDDRTGRPRSATGPDIAMARDWATLDALHEVSKVRKLDMGCLGSHMETSTQTANAGPRPRSSPELEADPTVSSVLQPTLQGPARFAYPRMSIFRATQKTAAAALRVFRGVTYAQRESEDVTPDGKTSLADGRRIEL